MGGVQGHHQKHQHPQQKQVGMYLSQGGDAGIAVELGELPVENAARHGGHRVDKGNVQIFFHCFSSFFMAFDPISTVHT